MDTNNSWVFSEIRQKVVEQQNIREERRKKE